MKVTSKNGAIRAVVLDAAARLTGEYTTIRSIGARGDVAATTEDGVIEVAGHRASLNAEPRNGHLVAIVRALAAGQQIVGRTRNGRVELHLPRDLDSALTAGTDNGFVAFGRDDSDAAVVTVQALRRVQATLYDGGPNVEVQTQNGSIAVDAD